MGNQFWLKEFSEGYRPDQAVLDLLNIDGVSDDSWHNDTHPHLSYTLPDGRIVELWFDAIARDEREFPESDRYSVLVQVNDHPNWDQPPTVEVESEEDATPAVARFKELIGK